MSAPRAPMLKILELKERTSAQGVKYMTGYFNGLKVLVFRNKDEDAEDFRSPSWRVFLQEREPRPATDGAARGKPVED